MHQVRWWRYLLAGLAKGRLSSCVTMPRLGRRACFLIGDPLTKMKAFRDGPGRRSVLCPQILITKAPSSVPRSIRLRSIQYRHASFAHGPVAVAHMAPTTHRTGVVYRLLHVKYHGVDAPTKVIRSPVIQSQPLALCRCMRVAAIPWGDAPLRFQGLLAPGLRQPGRLTRFLSRWYAQSRPWLSAADRRQAGISITILRPLAATANKR
jgi:hypothetical protein